MPLTFYANSGNDARRSRIPGGEEGPFQYGNCSAVQQSNELIVFAGGVEHCNIDWPLDSELELPQAEAGLREA